MVAGFLSGILHPKKTLLVVTTGDVLRMSEAQKRALNRDAHKAVALFTSNPQKLETYEGLRLATQFSGVGGLVTQLQGWEPKPDILHISDSFPQAEKMDRELTRAFLDTESSVVKDLFAPPRGAGR